MTLTALLSLRPGSVRFGGPVNPIREFEKPAQDSPGQVFLSVAESLKPMTDALTKWKQGLQEGVEKIAVKTDSDALQSLQPLFAAYYQTEQAPKPPRGITYKIQQRWFPAFAEFRQHKYQQALAGYQKNDDLRLMKRTDLQQLLAKTWAKTLAAKPHLEAQIKEMEEGYEHASMLEHPWIDGSLPLACSLGFQKGWLGIK